MKVKANAKINKYLKVYNKRNDGFHNLESVVIPINIYDEVEITESDFDCCECDGIYEQDNLAYKALKLFKKECGIKASFKIKIEKNIPIFSGLGGGSSDAAAVLKSLNEMTRTNLSIEQMARLSEKIGSDVPFFIYNETALVTGRGEIVEKKEEEDIFGILIFDGLEFSTKDIFDNFDEYIMEKPIDEGVYNYLEYGISSGEGFQKILEIKKELYNLNANYASMSGSGSSVFGLFENLTSRNDAFLKVKDKYKKVYKFENVKK